MNLVIIYTLKMVQNLTFLLKDIEAKNFKVVKLLYKNIYYVIGIFLMKSK